MLEGKFVVGEARVAMKSAAGLCVREFLRKFSCGMKWRVTSDSYENYRMDECDIRVSLQRHLFRLASTPGPK